MSTIDDTPATPAYRLEVLDEYRDVFQTIRDADDLPAWAREKYGQRPLDELARLEAEVADAE